MRDTLKHFRHYLLGARIVLKTDHKPLLKLLEQKDPFGRRATMIRDISEFEPYKEFIRGRDNFMADALSRLGWSTQLPQDDNPSVVAAMESKNQRNIPPSMNWILIRKNSVPNKKKIQH